MVLIGVSPSVSLKSASLVILQKRLKNLKKEYAWVDLTEVGLAVLETECARLAGNPGLCRKKRLYSQDWRPKKTVRSRPRFVFDVTETGIGPVTALRARGICVDGIRILEDGNWRKEPFGKALGDDYRVPEPDLVDTLVRVFDRHRLILPKDSKSAGRVSDAIERVRKEGRLGISSPGSRSGARMRALALPLWFRETVPYRRAYRAT